MVALTKREKNSMDSPIGSVRCRFESDVVVNGRIGDRGFCQWPEQFSLNQHVSKKAADASLCAF